MTERAKIYRGAHFSEDRLYRYSLTRRWGSAGMAMVIGLNPSTADERTDDPTIRRCMAFAQDWGYGGVFMLNIFAFRSSSPKLLSKALDPIGTENDSALVHYASESDLIIAAWGARSNLLQRGRTVREDLLYYGYQLYHLGLTKYGQPKHPLYLPKTVQPQLWT